jgi:hypothetical protein
MRVWLLSSTSCSGANDESHPQLVVLPLGLVPAGANSCQKIRGGPNPNTYPFFADLSMGS